MVASTNICRYSLPVSDGYLYQPYAEAHRLIPCLAKVASAWVLLAQLGQEFPFLAGPLNPARSGFPQFSKGLKSICSKGRGAIESWNQPGIEGNFEFGSTQERQAGSFSMGCIAFNYTKDFSPWLPLRVRRECEIYLQDTSLYLPF